jgi:hypothetical protein
MIVVWPGFNESDTVVNSTANRPPATLPDQL